MKTGRILWFDGLEGLVVDDQGKSYYMHKSTLPETSLYPESLTNRKIRFYLYENAYSVQIDKIELMPETKGD
jgi:hypothetical protein